MKKISLYLYKKACILGLPLFRGRRVEADLARLYPGERVEYVKTQYYVKKLSLTLTVLLVGLLLGLMVRWNAVRSAILEEEGAVLRGDLEAEQLWLEADDGESRRTFLVEVSPREPTEQEAAALLESFLQNITVRVLNGNEDFAHITGDLALQEIKIFTLYEQSIHMLGCNITKKTITLYIIIDRCIFVSMDI